MAAQLCHRLVDGKTRPVGGDLEQHSPRLAEVHRVKILAVDHRSNRQPKILDRRPLFELLLIGGRTERHMVDCPHPTGSAPKARCSTEVHNGPQAFLLGLKSVKTSGLVGRLETQSFSQELSSTSIAVLPYGCAVETADGVLRRHRPFPPWHSFGSLRGSNQLEQQLIRILERKDLLVEATARAFIFDSLAEQALDPESERAGRNRESCGGDLAGALPPPLPSWPGEESQNRAGPANLVAIIKVIACRIIEVDGQLHQPKTQEPGVEVQVSLGVARYRRDVVDAHGVLSIVECLT